MQKKNSKEQTVLRIRKTVKSIKRGESTVPA